MQEGAVVSSVEFQLMRATCPKCGSKNIEVVWNCSEPEILRYECRDCKEVRREYSPVQRGPR
jgi:transposase-like protein